MVSLFGPEPETVFSPSNEELFFVEEISLFLDVPSPVFHEKNLFPMARVFRVPSFL